MAYTELLNSLIENSGLSVKEIAERCTASGVKVTSAYISTLRNDKNNRAPSDEMSRAIAKACNAKYENILVIEAYLDKSPKEITDLLNMLKDLIIRTSIGMFDNGFKSNIQQVSNEILNALPLAEVIATISNENLSTEIKKQYGAFSFKAKHSSDGFKVLQEIGTTGFAVSDDGMKPVINKGDKVNIEIKELKDLKTGDILCYTKESTKKVLVRKAVFNGSSRKEITLLPINTEFSIETAKTEDLHIIGKVTQVISEIK